MARDAAKDNPGTATQVSVSVIVVAWQSGPDLTRCLSALAGQTLPPLEILLVDNASTDGAPEAAMREVPGIVLVPAGANLGFAAGVNLGARQAQGEWLALINPDAFATPDWLERLLAGAARNPAVACFGCRQAMADAPGRLDGLGDVMSLPGIPYRGGYGLPDPGAVEEGECFSACGGAMLVRRSLFEALGGFDEDLFMYCEDVDLGYRIRLAGGACMVIPDALVDHVGSASTGGAGSDFASFHGARPGAAGAQPAERAGHPGRPTDGLRRPPTHPGDPQGHVMGDRPGHDLEPPRPPRPTCGDSPAGLTPSAARLMAWARQNVDQFDPEDQGRAGRDRPPALVAVSEVRRYEDAPLIPRPHELQGLDPARDQPVQGHDGGNTPIVGAVKDLAGQELTLVVHLDLVPRKGPEALGGTGTNHRILQARGQGLHPGFGRVLRQESLFRLDISGQDLGVGAPLAGGEQGQAGGQGDEDEAHQCLLQTARGG